MHTRIVKPKHGPRLVVRPLRDGDALTVLALFERLSERSRRARFHGSKPSLSAAELGQLARVDSTHHVLVAHVRAIPSRSRSHGSSATAAARRSPSPSPTRINSA